MKKNQSYTLVRSLCPPAMTMSRKGCASRVPRQGAYTCFLFLGLSTSTCVYSMRIVRGQRTALKVFQVFSVLFSAE
ncbi:hypothetical protein K469DRAFT_144530 [Zopfia rhizophila CBS 207.26]|uniref:Uncharacterized protein n=1 Tax=Zopfia rhizophila CBS 207.26 TaxID=1314779 RepID=A0A6A6E4K4_9PEZI|nr:hypothetical protein K469DRAFT_144530 [Zopfia rhizophila CBS 207.26]